MWGKGGGLQHVHISQGGKREGGDAEWAQLPLE